MYTVIEWSKIIPNSIGDTNRKSTESVETNIMVKISSIGRSNDMLDCHKATKALIMCPN